MLSVFPPKYVIFFFPGKTVFASQLCLIVKMWNQRDIL